MSFEFEGLDLRKAFNTAKITKSFQYRDALLSPYGRPDLMTEPQSKGWKLLHERTGAGPLIAMIAAKGASKTHFGGAFATHQVQTYAGSMGCVISNTYTQALDNAGAIFNKIIDQVGFGIEFFERKKIGGRRYSSVWVITLPNGEESYVLIRSFDAVDKLEGTELDWLWVEEVQDAEKEDFITAFSRVRGKKGDNAVFVAGMPDFDFHWMYSLLPDLGFVEEELFDPEKDNGIFLEFSVYENTKNLSQQYIERNEKAYGEDHHFLTGKRSSNKGLRTFHAYKDHIHRKGRMSEFLTVYDPNLPLYLFIDFNVAPFSYSVWQEKKWNDLYDVVDYTVTEKGELSIWDENGEYESWEELASPNKNVIAQVDEFELWNVGTSEALDAFAEKYSDHVSGVIALGDATGNSSRTSADNTDWEIVEQKLSKFHNVEIIKGLVANYNYNTGITKYSNPSVKATINIANRFLTEKKVCFLPESSLKSGGCAKAVAMMKNRPDGGIDKSNDRKDDTYKEAARTHFGDGFRYGVVHFNGGVDMVDEEQLKDELKNALTDIPSVGRMKSLFS